MIIDYGDDFDAKWTDNLRCPQCGRRPESCDMCHYCDNLLLLCISYPEGLEAATEGYDSDGTRFLVQAIDHSC